MPITYKTLGTPDHPSLLFIHGLGASSSQTTSALTSLSHTWLIAPDMPGHGQSLHHDHTLFSFDHFADHIISLMDHLEIDTTDLGGLSMGSGIALNLALRYPERLKKLILLRPSWLHQPRPPHLELVALVGQWLHETDPQTARQNLHLHPAFQQLTSDNPPVAQSIDALFTRPHQVAANNVLHKMWQSAPFPSPEALQTIKNPTLILDTTRDELHPQQVARTLSRHLPHATRTTLPPRYHEPTSYQQQLNHHVAEFLNHHHHEA